MMQRIYSERWMLPERTAWFRQNWFRSVLYAVAGWQCILGVITILLRMKNSKWCAGAVGFTSFSYECTSARTYRWWVPDGAGWISATEKCRARYHGCPYSETCSFRWAIVYLAGVQLRLKMNEIMIKQGHEEPTGQAKITRGYNLPAKFVLHTVGPIIQWEMTDEDEKMLASCYRECLKLAAENGAESIAFCCLSTGVFRFPQQRAAEIAVRTVKDYLDKDQIIKQVILLSCKSAK